MSVKTQGAFCKKEDFTYLLSKDDKVKYTGYLEKNSVLLVEHAISST